MKAYIIFFLLLLFIPATAAELTIEPGIVDTYFLYSGMGGNQTSKYIFHSSHDVNSCEMVPQNDSVRCMIDEGYIVEVWFTTTGLPYIGELHVTDDNETASSTIIIRTHDFGSYSETTKIPIGSLANASHINLFFSVSDEKIIGIRNWLVWWFFILLGFSAFMAFRK